jgi:HEAT repeat protein
VQTRSLVDINIVEFKHTMQMRSEEEVVRALRKALRNEICVEEIRSETTKHAIELILKLLLPNRVELKLLGLTRNPEIVPYLLLSLGNSSSEDTHRTIIKALGQIDCDDSILAISKYLPDKRFSVRWEAIRALENIGNQLAAQILYQELLEDDSSIQNHYDDLSKIFKHLPFKLELDNLLNDLDDQDPSVRRKTARLLGAVGDPKAISKLSSLLCDQDSEIKREAACALSYLGSEAALPALVEALNASNDYQSASIAAKALGNIGTDGAINALINSLKSIGNRDTFGAVIQTLGHLRNEKAIPALLNLWKTVNVLYNAIEVAKNGDDVNVFRESIRASSHLHDGKTIFILVKLFGFDCWNLLWQLKDALI